MSGKVQVVRVLATPVLAIAIVLAAYQFARVPAASPSDRAQLASRFRFSRAPLPEVASHSTSIRAVNASLQNIDGWISTVGAGVALNDLDGDGLPNDACIVDARTNTVLVAAVPGTPARYAPLTLEPGPDLYDPATMAPTGCVPGDLNEDGAMDLLVTYWGRTPVAFLRQPGAPLGPTAYTAQPVLPGNDRWFTDAATLADLDGDGHLDLVIGNYFPDGSRILDASAATDTTMQAGMSRAFNGAGPQFLLWTPPPPGDAFHARFSLVDRADAGLTSEQAHGWTLAVAAADLDNDMLPEIYLANDFGPDRLLYNRSSPGHLRFDSVQGQPTFWTPSSKVLGRDSFKGMGVDFADLNNRGLQDILVSNITESYALEESNFAFINTGQVQQLRDAVAPFVDDSEALGLARSGWGWDVKAADFDNSGSLQVLQATGFLRGTVNRWPELQELAMGNPELLANPVDWPHFQPGDDLSGGDQNPFYVRNASGQFVDLSSDLGLSEPQVSRGIAVADVDGDGALDFAVSNQWGESSFYRNACPNCGQFLGLHLLLPLQPTATAASDVRPGHPGGDTPGRPAIGATATVYRADGERYTAQVDGGNGHSGRRSNDLHVGLGNLASDAFVRVDVRWRDPDGVVQSQTLDLKPGWHTVVLGWPGGVEQ